MPRRRFLAVLTRRILSLTLERFRASREYVAMKIKYSILTTATLLLAATALSAQTSGTSHPEALDDTITVAAPQPVKPSPAVPMAPAAPMLHEHDASATVQPAPVETAAIRHESHLIDPDDDNSGIVTEVYTPSNTVPEGTLIRVKLSHEISTKTTERNDQFQAFLSAPIEHHGRIVIPAGSVLTGRVTELHTGHHLGKGAAIHLEPESITLPDGSVYKLNAQVVDLTSDQRARVSSEGTIISNDRTPGTVAALGVTTTTGLITGAALGGGVGAVVGAGIGAGVSTAIWVNQSTTQTLPEGTEIILSLSSPMMLENVTR